MAPTIRDDEQIRARAITHVEALRQRYGDVLHWSQIEAGFHLDDEKIHLATRARGIFAPAGRCIAALSARTAEPRHGRKRWYADGIADEAGLFEYRYQGTDPASRDNQWLRRCLDLRLPILYFFGVAPARYAVYTCFVVADDPRRLTFLLEPVTQDDRKHSSVLSAAAMVLPPIECAYALRLARQRDHQTRFREAVLDAYAGRCAICHLRHRELLDAAHIIPDGEPDGLAEVPNGLSLCKLHHAAYDSQAIGITPDRVVRIAPAILTERDGPMLEHGFKAFEGAKLAVPAQKLDWPKAERLAARWEALPWRG